MSDLSKLSGQECVNDRSKENDRRNEIEGLPLNSRRKFSENRRNLFVLVTIRR